MRWWFVWQVTPVTISKNHLRKRNTCCRVRVSQYFTKNEDKVPFFPWFWNRLIFITIPKGFITVSTLLEEKCPGGVLNCSLFLFFAKFSIFLELSGGPLSHFCRIGFPDVSYTSSSTRINNFALVDLTSLTIGVTGCEVFNDHNMILTG